MYVEVAVSFGPNVTEYHLPASISSANAWLGSANILARMRPIANKAIMAIVFVPVRVSFVAVSILFSFLMAVEACTRVRMEYGCSAFCNNASVQLLSIGVPLYCVAGQSRYVSHAACHSRGLPFGALSKIAAIPRNRTEMASAYAWELRPHSVV